MAEAAQPKPNLVPGLLTCGAFALVATVAGQSPFVKEQLHIGALLIVIVLGMLARSLFPLPAQLDPGIAMAQRPILRWAVAGLGFRLSLGELASVGASGLIVVLVCTIVSFGFGIAIARWFGLDEKLGQLMAVGTSICGASAIVATDSVVQSEKSQVPCSLGIITALGTLGILVYPPIGHALQLSPEVYSIWNGASLHELAQVVAAGQSYLPGSQELSTTVKLARICLLAPMVFFLAWWLRRSGSATGEAKVQAIPWFLVWFLAFVILNSVVQIPKEGLTWINTGVLFFLCVGMAGVGLKSGFQDVKLFGWKPLWVAAIQWLVLAGLSLGLAMLLVR